MAKIGTLPVYLQVGDVSRQQIGTLDLGYDKGGVTTPADAVPKLLRAAADEFERLAAMEPAGNSAKP